MATEERLRDVPYHRRRFREVGAPHYPAPPIGCNEVAEQITSEGPAVVAKIGTNTAAGG